MLATLDGPAYITRVSLHNPANVRKAKHATELALRVQFAGLGLSLVEFLSPCPVNWKMEPINALSFISEKMIKQFPLGDYKMIEAVKVLQDGVEKCTPK